MKGLCLVDINIDMLYVELGILLQKIEQRRSWVQSKFKRECFAEIARDPLMNKLYLEAERLIAADAGAVKLNYIDVNGVVHKARSEAVDSFQKK